MRVLIAHAFYRIPGGEDRYVQQQVELLGGHHDVELFSVRNDDLSGPGAAARHMLAPGRTRADLERIVESFRPDVIHVHNVYPALGAAPYQVSTARGIPLVMTVHNHRLRCPNGYRFTEGQICDRCIGGNTIHSVIHECFPTRKQAAVYASALWADRFVRHIDRSVSLFIAPSDYMADQLRGWGYADERIAVIRNFTDARPAAQRTAGDHGVYAGRLSSEKGLDVLIRALKIADDPPFEMLGDGPLRASLEELATELGLTNLRFRGHVDRAELDDVLGSARYFVMPSLWHENAPLAVLEAMSAGVPVIVTRRGGLTELEQLVVDAGNPNELSEAIGRLRNDDGPHADLVTRAANVIAGLSPELHRERLDEAYRSVLAP